MNGGESPDFINEIIKIKVINIEAESVEVGDVYQLESENDSNFWIYKNGLPNDNVYATNNQNIGELRIVFHDLENRILGVTFEFNAVNESNTIVEIREGEFDMTYSIN